MDARGGVLCREILDLQLQSRAGPERKLKVNLKEIRPASLWFSSGGFESSCTWTQRKYRPKRCFNHRGFHPLALLANRIFEATPHEATFARTAARR